MEQIVRITFVEGDEYGESREVPAHEVRVEPYGVVWQPAGEQPLYDRILPWHRIKEVMIDLPRSEVFR